MKTQSNARLMKTGLSAFCAALFALGLATGPSWAEEPEDKDPFEGLNRMMFGFNQGARALVVDPFADFFTKVLPPPVQEVVGNAASNLTEPLTAVSSVLQGDSENAGAAVERFLVNSTVGLAGTQDRATEMGIVARPEDLGQAAGASGVGDGPYIVLPLIGPSNARDAGGEVVNMLVNPLALAHTADGAVTYANNKDQLNTFSRTSLDPYVAEREAYLQNRRNMIANGKSGGAVAEYDPSDVPGND
ncbi:MAG: VacJ family lipoprotein [Rhodospirillales bacterium]|nr:VacJ family lipoprotein [Rhodospirillales bacterium]MCW8970637.1 VacJ family lipoprotein [Rhodospirillales bacterium]